MLLQGTSLYHLGHQRLLVVVNRVLVAAFAVAVVRLVLGWQELSARLVRLAAPPLNLAMQLVQLVWQLLGFVMKVLHHNEQLVCPAVQRVCLVV